MLKNKLITIFVFAAVVSGCTPTPAANTSTVPVEPVVGDGKTEEMDLQSTISPSAETAQGEIEGGEEVKKSVEPQPTPRAGLEATDPETVVLASGDIQLVEFFAFW